MVMEVPSPGLQVLASSAFAPDECAVTSGAGMPRLHIPGAGLAVDRPAEPQIPRSLTRPARPPITARAVAFPTISCCPGRVNVSGVECPTLPISQFGDGPSSGGLSRASRPRSSVIRQLPPNTAQIEQQPMRARVSPDSTSAFFLLSLIVCINTTDDLESVT